MFRITEDPSLGKLAQCLAKHYKNDTIVSVDIDKVGVMAAYSDPLCVCLVHRICLHIQRTKHTHSGSEYAAITAILSKSTDTIESIL